MSKSFRKNPAGTGKVKGTPSSKIWCNKVLRRIERQLMRREEFESLPYRLEMLKPQKKENDYELRIAWSCITDPHEKKLLWGK